MIERIVQVEVSGPERVGRWWSDNWKWLVSTLVGLLAVSGTWYGLLRRNQSQEPPLASTGANVHVFISYRRSDAEAWAGRLHDRLEQRLGKGRVFMDVEDIDYGDDFEAEFRQRLKVSDIALVLIGPSWLTVTDDDGKRRIDGPDDHVRTEVRLALTSRALVIPVLVSGAEMPTQAELPDELQELAGRNALRLHADRFTEDVDNLIAKIDPTAAQGG